MSFGELSGLPSNLSMSVVIVPSNSVRVTRLANRKLFVNCGAGVPDGFRCDTEGNLWCGWGGGEEHDGVAVFAPDGTMIGRILLPERCANLCFGGARRNRLFMAASHSLYSLYVNTQGAAGG